MSFCHHVEYLEAIVMYDNTKFCVDYLNKDFTLQAICIKFCSMLLTGRGYFLLREKQFKKQFSLYYK